MYKYHEPASHFDAGLFLEVFGVKETCALLFDLDGTLTDTLRDLCECVNEVLQAHGLPPHPMEAYRHFVGDGMRKLIQRALGDACTPALLEELVSEFLPLYDRECLRYVSLYSGIAETVASLKTQGFRLAVVTNKPERQAQKIVAHLFPPDTFVVVHGNVPQRPTKPDRAVVDLTLQELDVPAERALFVGDSDVDVLTAQNAGLLCIGCCWGFRGERELTEAGAAYLAHTASDIVAICESFCVV